MEKTPAQLTHEIHEATRDFSSSLRHLAEEAGRRLTEGQGDEALKKAFRYATYILGFIESGKFQQELGMDQGLLPKGK